MGFKCGIVGLPNVGKSTLFNALTRMGVGAENYPFCTIEPNIGTVPVPDERLDRISRIAKSRRTIPTVLEFVDIAGLVAGASKGEGLGNRFLEHIRRTHTIAQVVRCFEGGEVIHVADRVDPVADIETIGTELLLADLEVAERAAARAEKAAKAGGKDELARRRAAQRLYDELAQGKPVRGLELDAAERAAARELNLITAKPMIVVANVDEGGGEDGARRVDEVRKYVDANGLELLTVSAKLEAELQELDEQERAAFAEDAGDGASGLERVIAAGYRALELLTFFTAGPKEARAWTTRTGSLAPQAAGCIHSDFEQGFIRAEVIAYEDYVACGGEHGAKEAGKLRLEGKDYAVCEGDVVHFRFNV